MVWYKIIVKGYALFLTGLERRIAVVVGGGAVAARKAQTLLEAGAKLTVISPEINHEMERLGAEYPALNWVRRVYRQGDLENAWVVVAATDSPEVNHQVYAEAEALGCLVNVVDDPDHSNFILPAIVRRGEIQIAIGTGGASPALARRLREKLEQAIGPEYGELAAILAELRPTLIQRYPPGVARLDAALRLIDSNLLDIILTQGVEAARATARRMLLKGEVEDK